MRPAELERAPVNGVGTLGLECGMCGYGVARATPPERCPMCQRKGPWVRSRPQLLDDLHRYDDLLPDGDFAHLR